MSKIKLSNNIRIDSSSLGVMVDTSNVIASNLKPTLTSQYTATQDCFVLMRGGSTATAQAAKVYSYIDGVMVNNGQSERNMYFLHKGSNCYFTGEGEVSDRGIVDYVFGCK